MNVRQGKASPHHASTWMLVGSDTAPVREILNKHNGLLVPFFDIDQIADRVIEALALPDRFRSIRIQARKTIVDQYNLVNVCLPKMTALIRNTI